MRAFRSVGEGMTDAERHALSLMPLSDIVAVTMVHCQQPLQAQMEKAAACQLFLGRTMIRGRVKIQTSLTLPEEARRIWFGFRWLLPDAGPVLEEVIRSTDWSAYSHRTTGWQQDIHFTHIYKALTDGLQQ